MNVDVNDLHERGIGICCMCEALYPAAYEEHRCPECLRGACTDCWLESQAQGRRGQCLPCAARWNPKARSIQLEREAEAQADAAAKAAAYTRPFKIISGEK